MRNMIGEESRYTLRHYLTGALPARLGDEMSGQAILLLTLTTTGSIATGSLVLAALTFSVAIGGPLLGALLDRSPHPGRGLSIAIGIYALIFALMLVSLGHTSTLFVLAIALAGGFLMPAVSGGWSSRLGSFIPEKHMARASAIDAATFNMAGLVGPALAGLIAAWFGVHWAVAALVALLLAAIPMAWRLPRQHSNKPSLQTSFVHDLLVGFRVIIEKPKLLRITIVSVTSYSGIGMLWVAYPLIGIQLLGDAGYGAALASVLSISALIATITYAKWPTIQSPDAVVLITTLILALAMLFLLLANTILTVLIALLVVGLADGPQLAAIFTIRHREAPERSRGQIFTTGASLKIAAAAFGAAIAGQLAAYSVSAILWSACMVQLMAAGAYVVFTYSAHRAASRKPL